MASDFVLACAAWQAPTCPEYYAAAAAVDALNSDLGCARTLQFADAVWHLPHLKSDPAWCGEVLRWVELYRRWAEYVQPWGWSGPCTGPGMTLGSTDPRPRRVRRLRDPQLRVPGWPRRD